MNNLISSIKLLTINESLSEDYSESDDNGEFLREDNEQWKIMENQYDKNFPQINNKTLQKNRNREFLNTIFVSNSIPQGTKQSYIDQFTNINEHDVLRMWFLSNIEKRNMCIIRIIEKNLMWFIDQDHSNDGIDKIKRLPIYLMKPRTLRVFKENMYDMNRKFDKRKYGLYRLTMKYQKPVFEIKFWKNEKNGKSLNVRYYQNWKNIDYKMKNYTTIGKIDFRSKTKIKLFEEKKKWVFLKKANDDESIMYLENLLNENITKNFQPLWVRNVIEILLKENEIIKYSIGRISQDFYD